MRRNDRRAAREGKRAIPDFTPLTADNLELSEPAQPDPHAANDQRALELQIYQERHVSGTTRGLY